MARLTTLLRNSRGRAAASRHLSERSRAHEDRPAWTWPYALVFIILGVAALLWCIFKGYGSGVIFFALWLVGLAYSTWPSRRAWKAARDARS